MPSERWSLDFAHDTLENSRRLSTVNTVDDFTREALAIEVDTSISGSRVARVLDWIADERGLPQDHRNGQRYRTNEPGDACVVGKAPRKIPLYRAG
jgi:transposase InsO family protein